MLDKSGRQTAWNYGTRMSPYSSLRAGTVAALEGIRENHPRFGATIRKALTGMLKDWPNPDTPPTERLTFWVSEANLAIQAATLRRLGGFDEKLREHEIQDLAIRSNALGLTSRFNPAVAVTHHAVDVRDYDRNRAMMQAEWYIIRKHGLGNWLLPPRP